MYIQSIISQHIESFVKKKVEFIMDRLKRQEGFISLEESKLEVNNIYDDVELLGTDYIFNGKRFLTIYPTETIEENGKYIMRFNYLDY